MKLAIPSFCTNRFLGTLAICLASASLASAQSVVTDPVGYVNLTCSGSSDTILSVPVTRPSEFTGSVASVAGSTVTITGSTGWTANQWVYLSGTAQHSTYYALIGPNPVALAGTVSTGSGSQTITGVGTSFTTAVHVNDTLIANSHAYFVSAIASDTSLTVSTAAQDTASGLSASVGVISTKSSDCVGFFAMS